MHVVIEIPKFVYDMTKAQKKVIDADVDIVGKAIVEGSVLPDNATNGDVIKALFPDGSQVKGAGIYVMNDNKSNIFYDFDWWNALYKVGDTDE